jgi:hypothetical protein
MRPYLVIATVTVLVVGFAAKVFFFSGSSAEANVDPIKNSILDVSKMHVNTKLPMQKMHDMTFVFSDND